MKGWPDDPLPNPKSSLPPRPHPRTGSQQRWVGSLLGRHTGSCLLCSHSGRRHRAGGYGHTRPHLGQRGAVGLRKGPNPFPLPSPPTPAFQSGGGLLDFSQAAPSSHENRPPPQFPTLMIPPAARVSPGHHLLHVAFLPQSCPLLKGPTSTRVSSKEEEKWRAPSYLEKGEKTLESDPPNSLSPHPSALSPIALPLCLPIMSLSSPHSKWGRSMLGLSTLTLAGGPRPSGMEASRAGTVIGACRVVTAAWSTGWWLLGTFIHILFTC